MDDPIKKKRRLKLHSTILFTSFVIFLWIVTIIALVAYYNGGYYLVKLIQDKLIHRVVMSRGVPFRFKEIYTIHDVKAYIQDVFLPAISGETGPKERTVKPLWTEALYMTEDVVVVGVPRLRTHKVRKVKCNVMSELQTVFEDCYGPYEEVMENRNSEGTSAGMFRYRTEQELHGTSHSGRLATYSGGGAMLELNSSREVAAETLLAALGRGFVEPGTRTVILEMSVFSRSLQLYALIRLLYERTPGGGVVASYKITLITTKNGADITLLFFVVIYIGILIYDIALRREDLIRLKFWVTLDVAILLGLVSFFIQDIYLITYRLDIPLMIRDRTDFINFAHVAYLTESVHNIHAIIMFLLWMRLFRFIECTFTMLSIQDTFSQASAELMAFGFIFLIAFAGFAIMASLLFGSQLEDYRTPFYAFAALMRAIVGDYDYEEIDRLEPVMASIFLFFFILIIILSFLNFFIAMLMDSYTRIRKEQPFAPHGPKDKYSHLEHLWAKIRGAPKVECWRAALLKANFPPKAVKQILERNELSPCGPVEHPKLTKIIEYERLNYKLDVDIIKMRNHIEQLNMRMVFLGYAAEEMSRNTDILSVNFKRVLHDNFDEVPSSEEEIDKAMDKSMKQFANLKEKKSFSRKSSDVGPSKIPLNCGPSCFITQYQTTYEVHPLTKAAMMRAGRSSEDRQAKSLDEYLKKTKKAELGPKKVHKYFKGRHLGSKTQTSTDGNLATNANAEISNTLD